MEKSSLVNDNMSLSNPVNMAITQRVIGGALSSVAIPLKVVRDKRVVLASFTVEHALLLRGGGICSPLVLRSLSYLKIGVSSRPPSYSISV